MWNSNSWESTCVYVSMLIVTLYLPVACKQRNCWGDNISYANKANCRSTWSVILGDFPLLASSFLHHWTGYFCWWRIYCLWISTQRQNYLKAKWTFLLLYYEQSGNHSSFGTPMMNKFTWVLDHLWSNRFERTVNYFRILMSFTTILNHSNYENELF